jgi:ring-1,2-phenylacetyl-CoA epoxidase subunit PaaD
MLTINEKKVWDLLELVSDPEVPVLTIVDLGIVRGVNLEDDQVEIVITPTYSGCPAMDMISVNIKATLQEHGLDNTSVKTVLSPAWTTDWMSDEGKRKLKEYGIAPPEGTVVDKNILFGEEKKVECPHCSSRNSKLLSQFGSTACKALYQCQDCKEPFDYFKCH